MDMILGIDVGTTGTKSMLIDAEGRILASAYKGYPFYSERPDWAEQDAQDWWDAVVSTVRECVPDPETGKSIRAMALSSQGASLVAVDDRGVPLRRAISWMDKRGTAQRDELVSVHPQEQYYDLTGSMLTGGGNLIQIKWLRDNEPETFHKADKFLSTIEYIHYQLTGKYVIDPTSAAMTQLMNIRDRAWDRSILDLLGIGEERLPAILSSGAVIGSLTQEAAKLLGLHEGVQIISGGHDQYCAALGAGALEHGDVVLSTGTAWVVLCITEALQLDPRNNFYAGSHVMEGKWGLMASLETGGVCLEWLRNNILSTADGAGREEFVAIDRMASQRSPGSDGLMFYPHFTGAESPNWAPKNKGTFLGLDLSHDRYHLARAVMEGVGYEIRWMLETLQNRGIPIRAIKMLGGAAKSALWPEIIADITGVPVRKSDVSDMTCIGAAILAGKGAGVFSTEEEGFRSLVKGEREILPDAGNAVIYERLYQQYKNRFHALERLYLIEESASGQKE